MELNIRLKLKWTKNEIENVNKRTGEDKRMRHKAADGKTYNCSAILVWGKFFGPGASCGPWRPSKWKTKKKRCEPRPPSGACVTSSNYLVSCNVKDRSGRREILIDRHDSPSTSELRKRMFTQPFNLLSRPNCSFLVIIVMKLSWTRCVLPFLCSVLSAK